MTITTNPVLSRANCTSFTEARMVACDRFHLQFHDGGSHCAICGSTALMPSTVSMTLASACLKMMITDGACRDQPACRVFSVPSIPCGQGDGHSLALGHDGLIMLRFLS